MRQLLCSLIGFFVVSSLSAQTRTWTGAGADDNWGTAANWGGTAPVAGNSIGFAGTTRLNTINNLAADTNIAGIFFLSGAGTFNLAGNRITLGGNITQSGTALQTIDLNMVLSATRFFTQGSAAATTTGNIVVNGVVSGSGGLVKAGANTSNTTLHNTLTLTAANTYTGGTYASSGSLTLSGAGSVLNSSGIYVDNGAAIGSIYSMGGRLLLDNSAGNLNRLGDTTPVYLRAIGNLQLTGNATADTTETIGQINLGSTVSGGRGIITLDGTAAGRLHTLAAAGLTRNTTSTLLARGTNLGQADTNATRITLASTSGLSFVGTSSASGLTPGSVKDIRIVPYMVGDITATGNGSSFVTYDAVSGLRPLAASEYTVLSAGFVNTPTPENTTGFNGTITSASPTVNSLRFVHTSTTTLAGTGTLSIASGALANFGTASTAINGFSSITFGDGTWNEGVITSQGSVLTINSPIHVTGGGGITKAGASEVVLTVANTYTGETNIHQGRLTISHPNALGSTSGRTVVSALDGGQLALSNNISVAEPIMLVGENGGFGAALVNLSGTNTLTGLLSMTGSSRVSIGGILNVTGGMNVVTSAQLVINGSGTLNFSGQPVVLGSTGNFYMDSNMLTTLGSTGHFWNATRVSASGTGTILRMMGENALPERSELILGVNYALNGNLDLNGFNQLVGSLYSGSSGTGTTTTGTRVITSATPATLTVNQFTTTTYDGFFSGAVSLVKSGTGSLALMGNNTTTGTTSVNNGTLILDYTTAANGSKLADGAALNLGTATLQLDRTATSAGSHVEVVASTTLQGAANITRLGGTSSLQLNEITREGGTLNIAAAGIATTDTLNNGAGMLGTWATFGGTDWAVNSTNAADGAITAFTGYSDINRLGTSAVPNTSAANVRIINGGTAGNITLAAAVTDIQSLNMTANGGTTTIDPGTGEILRLGAQGGILHATGASALLIGTAANDGTLTAGGAPDTAGELIIQRWSTNDLTLHSTIANNGTGVVSVTIGGSNGTTGATRLTGTNTYTGRTTLLAGRVIIDAETALGLNPAAFAADQLTLNGGTLSTATAFSLDDTNRGITLGASGGTLEATSAANALALTVAVPITGNGPLNKTGTGDAQLSVANSYTGHTYVNAGRLRISHSLALGTSASGVTVASGAALRLEGTGLTLADPIFIAGQGASSAGALQSNTSGNSIVSGLITMPATGSTRITATNTGRLFVTGGFRSAASSTSDSLIVVGGVTFSDNPVNMYTGRLELVSGTNQPTIAVAGNTYGVLNSGWGALSQVTVSNAFSPTGALELGYHTTFSGASPNTTFNLNATQQTASELRTGAISIGSGGYATPTRILTGTAGSSLTLNQTTNSLFDGSLQGAVSLVKNGDGILSLQGNNTTTGDTVLNAGGIELRNSAGNVQSGTVGTSTTVGTGNFTTVLTGLTNATTTLLVGQPVTGAGIPAGSFIASIDSNSQVTIRSTVAATAGSTSATFGAVTGALTNSTLDYRGGALSFGVTTAATTLGGIKGTQNLNLTNAGNNPVALTVGGNNQSTLYSGAISGSGSLIKTGTGSLELTAASTHTGGITVNNGSLLVNNSSGSGTGFGTVSVLTGATLGGTGSIGSASSTASITLNSGGTLRIGTSHGGTGGSPADLELATSGLGTLTLSGTVQFDLFSRSAGINSLENNDLLRLTSATAVSLSGTLEVLNSTGSDTTTWAAGDSWRLFDWSAVSAETQHSGNFSNLILPTLNAGLAWDTSALFTTGFITITPEPGRAFLLAIGGFSLLLRRRRRVG
ncbi:beta strand repeat-containing protein [Prosthecobacter dejongeii]|uniref:Autotransporter-associated beta strand protein n=1 Tax=Prosthecobacter dejongeii TaxID=48465 RepID=A0A7W8DND0_9BACT|nr:autotransporter-associated beta strand repeat-containing protein [Prosthecobacter dejongeii]MBB5036243.1 autotransporter-associated beta strand protein [Prosthecobacter dejongeii]